MTPEKVRCIGCNSMVDARAVTNIATKEKPFTVCPQCAFIAGMYVVVQGREDKMFEPGAFDLSRIAAPIRKIVKEEYLKDPVGTTEKYMGKALDEEQERKKAERKAKREAKKREKEEAERKAKEIAEGVFHVPHALYKKIQLKNRRLILLPLEYRPFNARKGKVLTIVSDNGNVAKRLIRRAKTIRNQGERVIACILEEKNTKIA